MKFSKSCFLLALIFLLSQIHGTPAKAAAPKPSQQSPLVSVEKVLWWLPEDTELVAVLQGDIQKNATSIGISQASMNGLGRGEFAKQLGEIPISRILEGSRKFRDTQGFGLMPFEGCSVIDLQSGLSKEHSLMTWLEKNAKRTAIIAGSKTFVFEEKLEQDKWQFFIVQPRPDLLLCATNRNFLESVLIRRARSAKEREKTSRALPANLPEWKYVDTASPEWALRHYRKDQARLDPTSPFQGSLFPDPEAIGLTYSQDPKEPGAIVRYLTAPSSTMHMAKIHKEFWRGLIMGMGGPSDQTKKWRPVITTNPKGVVEMKFSFTQPSFKDVSGMFVFGLWALMGHAIIV